MKRNTGVAVALAAVAATVVLGGWLETPAAGRTGCWFTLPGYAAAECRYVAVPAFRGSDPGGEVLLPVATISSSARGPAEEVPVVLIGGGPGGSVFESVWPENDPMAGWFETVAPLIRERDAVLFDQRGVGPSVPNMNCPEIDRLAEEARKPVGADAEEDWGREFDALEACARRLRAEGVDPAMLSTPATARDVVAILDDLGHEKADIWAFSYGTRVALALLRDHGDRIGRVLLDGVVPPYADGGDMPELTALAFGRLFQACRDDPACAKAFPGLEERFEAEIERLNARPRAMALLSDRWSGFARVDGDAVVRGIHAFLYWTEALPYMPLLLWIALDENATVFTAFLEVSHYGDFGLDEGVTAALWCREELPFLDDGELRAGVEKHGVYGRPWRLLGDPGWCGPWNVRPAGPEERRPVGSEHTVLLVSGWFDPITPSHYAEAAAAHLPNSRHLVFRGAGHTPTSTEPCAAEFAARFFTSPRPLNIEPRHCPVFTSPPAFAVDPALLGDL